MPASYRVRARNLVPDSDNRIHADDVAQQFGFRGALVPGVDVFAYASHPFMASWGADFLSGGRMQARFRRPVYDGDEITVSVTPGDDSTAFTVTSDDAEVRSVGTAERRASIPTARTEGFATVPLPTERLPVDGPPLPLGPLGSVAEVVDLARHAAYLDGIEEPLSIFRADHIAHPGALLRLANELLIRNVALGPWIHTASDATFLAPAQLPATLTADGVVTEVYERNGHRYVRYDVLVRADGAAVMYVDHTAVYRLAGIPSGT